MSAKKRGNTLLNAILALTGAACALVLAALFYGAMAYQLAGEGGEQAAPTWQTPAPLAQGVEVSAMYPGALLALSGAQLVSETAEDVTVVGVMCRVISRVYALEGGGQAEAISAYPAAYLQRLSQESWTPQQAAGFVLAGLDAVLELRGQEAMLTARDGERVYMLRCPADEQAAYALGAAAQLQE